MADNSRSRYLQDNFDYLCGEPKAMGAGLWLNEFQNAVTDGGVGVYQRLKPGTTSPQTFDGRRFRYVEISGGAVAEGDLLVPAAHVGATAAATSATDNLTITCTIGSTIYANQFRGGYMYCSIGTGLGYRRRIVNNQAATSGATATFQIERPFPTDLSGATLRIWHPHRMIQMPSAATGPGDQVSGVSFGAVSAPVSTGWYAGGTSYYGWMQIAGSCDAIKFTGSIVLETAAIPVGLVPAASVAGTAQQQVVTPVTQVVFAVMDRCLGITPIISSPGLVSGTLIGCTG